MQISELDLGSQFPEIRSLELSHVDLHEKEGHIENLDILLDLHYKGDFLLKIDADMMLGKKGSLSMKGELNFSLKVGLTIKIIIIAFFFVVKQLTGKARLQFTRKPFTHWSLSFINEPVVDLAIESKIQGRQMQSNVTSLISTAVKKAIRRKHTLPNYKLRFKPFFSRLIYEDNDLPIQPSGNLEVVVRTLSRLNYPNDITHVYCTLTLSQNAFVTATQLNEQILTISLDVEIHKAKNQQIGIVFKQIESSQVLVESIIPNTPAAVAELKRGDALLSIEGRQVQSINHVAKLLKNLNKSVFTMRVERTVNGFIKNDDTHVEDFLDVYEDFNGPSVNIISFSKNSDSVQIGTNEVSRSSSKDRGATEKSSNESSITSTPSTSPRKVQQTTPSKTSNSENVLPQHSTIDCAISNFIKMNDSTQFELNQHFNYLNVNIYGRSSRYENSLLLGYLIIPLDSILTECSDSNLYIEKYMLKPPNVPDLSNHPLSTQSGFSSQICFGDACISFLWNPGTSTENIAMKEHEQKAKSGSQDKLDVDSKNSEVIVNRKHDFIRTTFNQSTMCDYCGKKIWLKDAVQCRDCLMSCHKKCIVKCQTSTVCTGFKDCEEFSPSTQPEFKVTTVDGNEDDDYEMGDEAVDVYKLSGHRQSFSDLLAQGIKRVNSANNLHIPAIVSSLTQNSKSLPPTPQHTPSRKQSITQNMNPFAAVVMRLEQIPIEKKEMNCDEIKVLVEPLMSWGSLDSLMDIAKTSSESLYAEHDVDERLNKINLLVSIQYHFS